MPDTNPTPVDGQRILAEHLRSIFVAPGCGTTSLRLRNSPDKLAESLALALALAGYEIIPACAAIPGPDSRDVPPIPDDHDSRLQASIDYDGGGVSVVAAVEDGVLDLYVEHDGHEFERQQRLRAAIPGPDSERIRELEAENERLRRRANLHTPAHVKEFRVEYEDD